MTRDEKIFDILAYTKGRRHVQPIDVPIELWIAVEAGERLDEWAAVCQNMVDWYYQTNGEPDTESCFAEFLRAYHEDADGLKQELKQRKQAMKGDELR